MADDLQRFRMVQGVRAPAFLYGTAWKEERTAELVRMALQAGFVGVDTANQRRHYVEAAVGEALEEQWRSGAQRSQLFVQTKFTYLRGQDERLPYDRGADAATQVAQSFASSLQHLRTDYLDAFLLHGPATSQGLTAEDWQVWQAMEALHDAGKVLLLGVSNFSREQLDLLCRGARVKPAFVQNRCYARTGWDRATRELCAQHGVVYQAFSLLTANARELAGPAAQRIAEQHAWTVPQVIFRFALQAGIVPLTGSSNVQHLHEDLAVLSLPPLNASELQALENLSSG